VSKSNITSRKQFIADSKGEGLYTNSFSFFFFFLSVEEPELLEFDELPLLSSSSWLSDPDPEPLLSSELLSEELFSDPLPELLSELLLSEPPLPDDR
jgi:hypothetical protein